MPRLQTSLLLHARSQSPLLIPLLRTCRDLNSAHNELRWLRQHVYGNSPAPYHGKNNGNKSIRQAAKALRLRKLCRDRGRGKPLQYILGTEFFGDLELECWPGVLIPRPETASLVTTLVHRLHDCNIHSLPTLRTFRILDLCSGTGCISLLLHHEIRKIFGNNLTLNVLGVDISARAIHLARKNLRCVGLRGDTRNGKVEVEFVRADILSESPETGSSEGKSKGSTPSLMEILRRRGKEEWDMIISNPPYISPMALYSTTARSVRNFEPRLALVPPALPAGSSSTSTDKTASAFAPSTSAIGQADSADNKRGDLFYPRLLSLSARLNAKILLVEVGDMAQAMRVARMALPYRNHDGNDGEHIKDSVVSEWKEQHTKWSVNEIEIWRDGLDTVDNGVGEMVEEEVEICGSSTLASSTPSSDCTAENNDEDECAKEGNAGPVEYTKMKVKIRGPKDKSEARGVVFWRS